ncbi:MAG: site-specific DNA-methyltransferase [Hyphomicrobiales bacterium]
MMSFYCIQRENTIRSILSGFQGNHKSIKRAQSPKGGRIDTFDTMKMATDVWADIPAMNPISKERLGYAAQKPLALLERIIKASSNEGDTVFDPFCGCATTLEAEHRLKRK